MENSSLGPTQIPRRLANSRPIPGKSAPPAIPCIRGGTAVRESESFRKASGSFSFGNREPLPSPPPLGRIVISRAEKTTRVFHRRFVPRSGWTHSPLPRNCDRSKTNGGPVARVYIASPPLDFSRPKLIAISTFAKRRLDAARVQSFAIDLDYEMWCTARGL